MLLEALMLVCFGVAWPVATYRMLQTRRPEGKGLIFTSIIGAGYVAGALSKVLAVYLDGGALAPVFWLYLFNTASVGCNGALQWYLARRRARATRRIAARATA